MTFLNKRIFPVVWFGFLAIVTLLGAIGMAAKEKPQFALLLFPAIMAVVGYLMMRSLVFDLVDEVWDDTNALIVINKGQKVRIPLTSIINVGYSNFSNFPRITLTLREPSTFGTDITFSPPTRLFALTKHPLASDLVNRVESRRRS